MKKKSFTSIIEFIAGDRLENLILKAFIFILAAPVILVLFGAISGYLMIKMAQWGFSPLCHNKDIISNYLKGYIEVYKLFCDIAAQIIEVLVVVLIIKIPLLRFVYYKKITGAVIAIQKVAEQDIPLKNGDVIKKGTTYFDLHVWNVLSALKYRHCITSKRMKKMLLRKKSIEGLIELIEKIEREDKYFHKDVVFRLSSHMVEKSVETILKGVPQEQPEKLPKVKETAIYFTVATMILLGTPLRLMEWKELKKSEIVGQIKTYYVYAHELIKQKEYLKKRLDKLNRLAEKE